MTRKTAARRTPIVTRQKPPPTCAQSAGQIGKLAGVFGRDDEAELVAVAPATLLEALEVQRIRVSAIGLALLAVPGDALALDVA